MRFTLGLAALGRPAYLNLGRDLPEDRGVETLRSTTWAILDAAYAAGVRRVDTARSYGRAEEFLAGWLDARGHDDVTVSSKWGYTYVGDWRVDATVHEVKEHTLPRFRAQWAESRALLGSRIALYQVHSLTVDSPLFADEPLLDALAELADSGQRLGFSTSGPAQADAVRRGLALRRGGVTIFTAVQSTWNLLEPSAAPALAEAHAAGAHVAIKEALANGRLAVEPPPTLPEPADAVALAAALAQPWADTVLIGPVTRAQLASNLRAASLDPVDPPDLAEPAAEYWATRSRLPWT
ncbi:aldo/keto reductase [Actinokineospora xionganensis]|uniref:Aldo/keto reductase n=1 Tax=Actinokineospora xionganensis TaxID=2684470 RepID=A0ABR7LD12_9PSEU|nr:aldo/keto reductase [Actinokineospora xionganensis]MBC6450614.1 aldo/keto reductase [Actinokineospora xionganensis]